jgi:predicted AAA+ superfamily ATPase
MSKRNTTDTPKIIRSKAEAELKKFISKKGRSGFVYFRGRRRVGKTTLLKKLQAENKNVFYFIGVADESNRETLGRFAKNWDTFLGATKLTKYKPTELDWSLCFDEITTAALAKPENIITIIFDEIQWIAKVRSGVIGTLKDKWIDWEKTNNIKVIICGSSNKFFVEQTGGEEKILRGLKTSADIVLQPLMADEVREHYFPEWSINEVLMLYMMLGGVPYYLNQLPRNKGFIRAINETIFTSKTIFLSEVDEVLNVEFNKAGVVTVKKILSSLGILGGTFSQFSETLNLSSAGLFETLGKLVDYSILKEKALYPKGKLKRSRSFYFYDDPYLLFYFSCLEKMRVRIEENEQELLFSDLIGSDKSLYIANFSGRAFEIYIRNLLTTPSTPHQKRLLDLIGIGDRDFEIYDSLNNENAGDFILVHRKLRTHFVIECKWTESLEVVKDGISQLTKFAPLEKSVRVEKILITNYKPGAKLIKLAESEQVKSVWIGELF